MNKQLLPLGILVVTSAACLCRNSSGQILIGNVPTTPADGASSTVTTTTWKGFSFTVPSQDYSVTSVDLRLANYSAATSANPGLGFYTDAAGVPGTLVGTQLSDAPLSLSATAASFNFGVSGSLTLTANTTYWLVLKADGGNFQWRGESPAVTPTGPATFGAFRRTTDSGSIWNSTGISGSFQINATPVPEPAHYTLAGAAALLAFGVRRKFFSKHA